MAVVRRTGILIGGPIVPIVGKINPSTLERKLLAAETTVDELERKWENNRFQDSSELPPRKKLAITNGLMILLSHRLGEQLVITNGLMILQSRRH